MALYAAGAIGGALVHLHKDKVNNALGASAAVYALIILNVCLNPSGTHVVAGSVPVSAWIAGAGYILYDLYGTTQVRAAR